MSKLLKLFSLVFPLGGCEASADMDCHFQRAIDVPATTAEFTYKSAASDFEAVKDRGVVVLLAAVNSKGRYEMPFPADLDSYEANTVFVPGKGSEIIEAYTSKGGKMDVIALDGRFSTLKKGPIDSSFFIESTYANCYNNNVFEYAREFNLMMVAELK